MARPKFKGNNDKRDGRTFVALPVVVLESPGYRVAGFAARALLIDIAMQYTGNNNGKLTACAKYLNPKGWCSNDTIVRARRELIDCGLLIETRKGARPNKAAWFALPWLHLDHGQGLDIDPAHYRRGGYLTPNKPAPQSAPLVPVGGAGKGRIAPVGGVKASSVTPASGAMRVTLAPLPAPIGGAYLEIPSALAVAGGGGVGSGFSPTSVSAAQRVLGPVACSGDEPAEVDRNAQDDYRVLPGDVAVRMRYGARER